MRINVYSSTVIKSWKAEHPDQDTEAWTDETH